MGQILSEEGDQDEAINCLIDALRWDSQNAWALLMMGNIFAKFKNDIPTALKYYDQAIVSNSGDHISFTNIGFLLFQQGKFEDAKKYLWEALKKNDSYPNAHHVLALIAEKEGDMNSAFYSALKAIKLCTEKNTLYHHSVKLSFDIAKKMISSGDGKKIFREYRHKLEFDGNREIDIVEDNTIPTAAKIEFAENYDRPKHIVRFNSNYPAVAHLVMHELVHLDFVIAARNENLNQLFISTQEHQARFSKSIESSMGKLKKMGVPDNTINELCTNLFEGLNRQAYNTPIDLFIENFLYNEFPDIRPYQFLSLYNLILEGVKAVTDKKVTELFPKEIISQSKVYNLVNAIQFKELYGIDLLNEFKASSTELKLSTEFYDEYLQYKEDKEPAEEYELILHWAEDLKLDKNFELVDEDEFRNKRTNIDNLLSSIENDPFDITSKDPYKKREMDKFQKSQQNIGVNMAVVMYMVDALQFFGGKTKEEIKKIAFEIAMQGTQGYRPNKEDYRIHSISGKIFSGYHILAYYYVSWALAIPDMLSELQLPYDEEYKLALNMHNTTK